MRLRGQMDSGNQVLKVKEVSEMLKIHATTLYKLIREGKIPSFKIGGEWRIRTDLLERWITEQRPQ